MAQAPHLREQLLLQNGGGIIAAAPLATVLVCNPDTSNLVGFPLYANDGKSSTLTQPLLADANGVLEFWTDVPQRVTLLVKPLAQATFSVQAESVSPDTFGAASMSGSVVLENGLTVDGGFALSQNAAIAGNLTVGGTFNGNFTGITGVAAGGALSGTYPNPSLAAGAVGAGAVANSSITAGKLNLVSNAQVPGTDAFMTTGNVWYTAVGVTLGAGTWLVWGQVCIAAEDTGDQLAVLLTDYVAGDGGTVYGETEVNAPGTTKGVSLVITPCIIVGAGSYYLLAIDYDHGGSTILKNGTLSIGTVNSTYITALQIG